MKILIFNAGSSSHKLSLYDLHNDEPVEPLWEGTIDWSRKNELPYLSIKTHQGVKVEKRIQNDQIEEGIKILIQSLWQGETSVIGSLAEIERIGHRVVHGGEKFEKPTPITKEVKDQIRNLIPLAPLHNPVDLEGIELMEKMFPSILQIAVFDTSFHLTMPEMIKTYPLPWEWKKMGIQRYGFHGISHQYCAERISKFLNQNPSSLKIINCHLGNGCSLCAIKEGMSYETTMGMTPLEGLMMGTRCGSIDPGILLYLSREHKFTQDELDDQLNFASGLKGIGRSSDMRDLIAKRQTDSQSNLAIQMFVHRLQTFIGAMAASLEGFNVLNFTGGIGENSSLIREETCRSLGFLSLAIDADKNNSCKPDVEISTSTSKIKVLVIHTREDWLIARFCLQF